MNVSLLIIMMLCTINCDKYSDEHYYYYNKYCYNKVAMTTILQITIFIIHGDIYMSKIWANYYTINWCCYKQERIKITYLKESIIKKLFYDCLILLIWVRYKVLVTTKLEG